MSDYLSQTAEPVVFRPQRSIAGFAATVTIEETSTDELEITKHPVEQGAQITDNAILQPATLHISAAWGGSAATETPAETYAKLRELQASRVPFDIVTGKRIYTNMLFKSLAQTTNRDTETILSISASFEEIIITTVTVTSVPVRSKQKNPGSTGATDNAGAKNARPVEKSGLKQASDFLRGFRQ